MKKIIASLLVLLLVWQPIMATDSINFESYILQEVNDRANAVRIAYTNENITEKDLVELKLLIDDLEMELHNGEIENSVNLLKVLSNISQLTDSLKTLTDFGLSTRTSFIMSSYDKVINASFRYKHIQSTSADIIATYGDETASFKSEKAIYQKIFEVMEIEVCPAQVSEISNKEQSGSFNNFKPINQYNDNTFVDFSNDEWYSSYIQYAYEQGIINGKGDRYFDPEGELTVAEAVTLASKVNKLYYGVEPVFDTSGATWYDNIILYAKNKSIIYDEFEGGYNQEVTRAEMVHIFANSLPADGFVAINEVFEIPDVDESVTYYNEIQTFYDTGILNGSDEMGTFNPSANVSRAEVATIISRLTQPLTRTSRNSKAIIGQTNEPEIETKALITWEVGKKKIPVARNIDGNLIYHDVYQGATLVKKGTLVADGLRALEDFYVRYGSHSYGCVNAEQYNALINMMDEISSTIDFMSINSVAYYDTHFKPYMDGTLSEEGVRDIESRYDEFKLDVLRKGDMDAFMKAVYIGIYFVELGEYRQNHILTDPSSGWESGYGHIFGRGAECNAAGQAAILYMDYLGYNTMVVSEPNHAVGVAYVPEIYGDTWLNLEDGNACTQRYAEIITHGVVVRPTWDFGIYSAGDYYNRLGSTSFLIGK